MTRSEATMRQRVARLVREALDERGMTYEQTGLSSTTLSVLISGKSDVRLCTLVRVAEALNYDVVINLRERRPS